MRAISMQAPSAKASRFGSAIGAAHRMLDYVARRRRLVVFLVGLLGLLASAAFCVRVVPYPFVHDEFSYLLEADTFASGRLANPPHPFWRHFESMHIIQQPTYAGKYPPGQGLALALGQALTGRPIVGVWISMAAACAAATWLLQGWLRPRWALLGGLLAVLWLTPTYWAQSYWGGAVAACGGALVYGALPRIVRQRRWWAGFHLGLGLAIMMYSRPYEGLVASLPAAVVLFVWLVRLGLRGAVTQGLPAVAAMASVLALATAWLASYHAAVTGNSLVAPYNVHDVAYRSCPTFFWQKVGPAPQYRHAEMADFYLGWERPRFLRKQAFFGMNSSLATRVRTFFGFFIGAVFTLPLLALWRNCRDRWLWLAAATCALVFLALTQTLDLMAHYAAPVTALVLVQVAAGMRSLRGWRWKGLRTGRWLSTAVIAICLLEYVVPLGRTWSLSDCPINRELVERQLESNGPRHLVFVRYSPHHNCHYEWVYNRADIDAASVVWAREISPAEDRRLRKYYADRKAWVVIADEQPPRLLPFGDASLAAYPRRPNPHRSPEASRGMTAQFQ
jgi:hypothetical protein